MNLADQINSHTFLYLSDIGEPEDNVLRLIVEEARANGEPQDFQVGSATLSGARVIASDEACYAYEILFGSYVGYSVRNGSYVGQDSSEEFTGRLFCVYSKSRFIDYIHAATFASESYPGKFIHYGINCLNHIVDVVSIDEPAINIIRDAQQAVRNDASTEWLS